MPYGAPIQQARYYVLTPELTPCPIGVRGDLYIGGAVLAQGDIGNGRQTATQFGPDPFASEAGARVCWTGGWARGGGEGGLGFLGGGEEKAEKWGGREGCG